MGYNVNRPVIVNQQLQISKHKGAIFIRKLTVDEKKLAVDNIRLAYHQSHVWARRRRKIEHNRLKSLCLLALVKAAKTYEEGHGTKFSTYACHCMNNEVRMLLRKRAKKEKEKTISYYKSRHQKNDDVMNQKIYEKLSTEAEQKDMAMSMWLKQAIKRLKPRRKKMLYLYYCRSKTQAEIGDIFGVAQSNISKIIKRTLSDLQHDYKTSVDLAVNSC